MEGRVILWMVAAVNIGLLLATKRAIDHYYLLPLYSVLPCWMGGFLGRLRRRGPLIAAAALASLLALNGWANWRDSVGNPPLGGRRWSTLKQRVGPLLGWLEARGIGRAYLTGEIQLSSSGMTYLAGERVILADLWRELFVDYGRLVDAAANPPIVSTLGAVRALRGSLQAIGVDFRETAVGGFRVLEPEPRFSTTFVPLPRDRWTITASHNPERAADLLDGDAATTWTPGLELMPGQWLEVDLGATELVARVDLLAIDWQDLPGSFRIEISPDGSRWETVVTVSEYWGPSSSRSTIRSSRSVAGGCRRSSRRCARAASGSSRRPRCGPTSGRRASCSSTGPGARVRRCRRRASSRPLSGVRGSASSTPVTGCRRG
jgi:hypothetical protein